MKQKDEIIGDLDEKLGQLGHGDQAYDSKKRSGLVLLYNEMYLFAAKLTDTISQMSSN